MFRLFSEASAVLLSWWKMSLKITRQLNSVSIIFSVSNGFCYCQNSSVKLFDYFMLFYFKCHSIIVSLQVKLASWFFLGVLLHYQIEHTKNPSSPDLKTNMPLLLRSLFIVGLLCEHFDCDEFGDHTVRELNIFIEIDTFVLYVLV